MHPRRPIIAILESSYNSQKMFQVPTVSPQTTSFPSNQNFKIDLYRSIPSEIPVTGATVSMKRDWKPFHDFRLQEGGAELAEIDEIASLPLLRQIWTSNHGTFYKSFWHSQFVSIKFRRLNEIDRRQLLNERECFEIAQNKRVLELFATCLDLQRLTGNFITQTFFCTLRTFYEDLIPKKIAARFMMQLTEGIIFIHDKNIVLRDLSPENILITCSGNLVISQFKNAIRLKEHDIYQGTSRVGLAEYAALETLQRDPTTNNFHFSKKTDVFSLGSILFEVFTSNAYVACPKELIPKPLYVEFYVAVLQKGRPFVRRHHESRSLEFYIKNGVLREKLQNRLTQNLRLACPDELQNSFIELFEKILSVPSTARFTAENIYSSEAFTKLQKVFDTKDSTKILYEECLTHSTHGNWSDYSVDQKEEIRSKLPSYFGFSKVYKRTFEKAQLDTQNDNTVNCA